MAEALNGMTDSVLFHSYLATHFKSFLDEDGKEQAFDFYNIPVNQDLNIYAKWQSNQLRDVTVRYVTEVDGVDVEVCSMHRDDVRVCIPAHLTKGEPL